MRCTFCLFLFAGFLVSCERRPASPATLKASPVVAPAWAKEDPSRWPQLVLTNKADFKGHSSLNGASAFLIEMPGDRIFAATALHLLGKNGGVEPRVRPDELQEALVSWRLFPRTKDDSSISATGLGTVSRNTPLYDWLILRIDPHFGHLPATPLTLRAKPAELGEEVFLVGVPYAEPDRVQNVYRGKVTLREAGDRFRFSISPAVDVTGFSGAPILDRDGQVLGVFSVIFEPRQEGDLHIEGGAEDSASVLKAFPQ